MYACIQVCPLAAKSLVEWRVRRQLRLALLHARQGGA